MKAALILEEMPKVCSECPCFAEDYTCKATGRNAMITRRPYSCKLKKISETTKYIDADKLITDLKDELINDVNLYNSHAEKEARDEKIWFAIGVLEEAAAVK